MSNIMPRRKRKGRCSRRCEKHLIAKSWKSWAKNWKQLNKKSGCEKLADGSTAVKLKCRALAFFYDASTDIFARLTHLMMSQLINDLTAHRKSYIDCNPIFARLAGGDLTRFHYLAYLRETYHLIKHTPKDLTIAANRVANNDERLANYFRNLSS